MCVWLLTASQTLVILHFSMVTGHLILESVDRFWEKKEEEEEEGKKEIHQTSTVTIESCVWGRGWSGVEKCVRNMLGKTEQYTKNILLKEIKFFK